MSKDNNGIKVNVLYDFEAQEEDELDLKAGDVITVFKQVNDAWWMVILLLYSINYCDLYFNLNFVDDIGKS